jgi:inner membrane protein
VDHRLYLLLAIATHGLVGYALVSAFTRYPPAVGLVGAVAPDVDLLFDPSWQFPLVHRGITHTPALAGIVIVALLLGVSVPVAAAFGVGVISHLIVDTFTRSGVAWLYPVIAQPVAFDLSIHGGAGTVLLWSGAIGLIGWEWRKTGRGAYGRRDDA